MAVEFYHPQSDDIFAKKASHEDSSAGEFSASRVFIFSGLFMLSMLVLIPLWNAMALLYDGTFMHMVGQAIPLSIIASCAGVVVLYVAVGTVFAAFSKQKYRTQQSILLVGTLFLLLLGVLLLLVSYPLAQEAERSYDDLWNNCDFGRETRLLTESHMVLHALRTQPDCKGQPSVEACEGFSRSDASDVLKEMEMRLKCSGFCYRPTLQLPRTAGKTSGHAGEPAGSESDLVQKDQGPKVIGVPKFDKLPTGLLEAASLLRTSRMATSNSIGQNSFVPYPPTLFSVANFEASCESMAARNMEHFAGGIALQTFYEGVVLVLAALVLAFMKIFGSCAVIEVRRTQAYGAMA